MAFTYYGRRTTGTVLTLKASGGSAALSMAGVSSGAARQSATLDLGANFAQYYKVELQGDFQATPTVKNVVNVSVAYGSASGAGWGSTSGTDSAYTGYASLANSVPQLEFIGAFLIGVASTAIQSGYVGLMSPKDRYCNFVIDNESGATTAAANTNWVITITPLPSTLSDT